MIVCLQSEKTYISFLYFIINLKNIKEKSCKLKITKYVSFFLKNNRIYCNIYKEVGNFVKFKGK